jgi:hypothetical protein
VHELWEKHLEWFRRTGNALAVSGIEGIAFQIDKFIRSSKEWTVGRLK